MCLGTFLEQYEDILDSSSDMGDSKEFDILLAQTIPLDKTSTFDYLGKLQISFLIILKFTPKENLVSFLLVEIDGHKGRKPLTSSETIPLELDPSSPGFEINLGFLDKVLREGN